MSSVYEDYMRSVYGYEPINYRNTYFQDFSVNQVDDSMAEELYPDIYKLVYPMVQKACMENTRPLNRNVVDDMTNEIYFAIEDENRAENRGTSEKTNNKVIDSKLKDTSKSDNKQLNRSEDRQIRNRGLNDLIRILILRELFGRPGFRPGRPPRPTPPPPMGPRPPMGPGYGQGGRPPFNRAMFEDSMFEY